MTVQPNYLFYIPDIICRADVYFCATWMRTGFHVCCKEGENFEFLFQTLFTPLSPKIIPILKTRTVNIDSKMTENYPCAARNV